MSTLPAGFEVLAPFADYWARDTTNERIAARCEASQADIQHFYDVMLPLLEAAVTCIDESPLHALPPDRATLAKLVLAMAQAAVAVEMHAQPVSPGVPYPNTMRVLQGAAPYG